VSPVPNSDLPKVGRKEKPALTVAQQDLLIASAPSQLVTFLILDAATGCRRGEVLALRWQDISGGEIYISRSLSQTKAGLTFKSTKSDRPRRIALPASAVHALELHCAAQAELRKQFGPDYQTGLDLVFCGPDGSPLRPDSISSTVSALCKRLKLPKGVSLHALRHTHVSHLFASGVPLTEISRRLGHSSPHVTATIYAHMLPGRDNLAAEAWEKFQTENREPKPAAKGIVQ
jgi:integrase